MTRCAKPSAGAARVLVEHGLVAIGAEVVRECVEEPFEFVQGLDRGRAARRTRGDLVGQRLERGGREQERREVVRELAFRQRGEAWMPFALCERQTLAPRAARSEVEIARVTRQDAFWIQWQLRSWVADRPLTRDS